MATSASNVRLEYTSYTIDNPGISIYVLVTWQNSDGDLFTLSDLNALIQKSTKKCANHKQTVLDFRPLREKLSEWFANDPFHVTVQCTYEYSGVINIYSHTRLEYCKTLDCCKFASFGHKCCNEHNE